MVFKLLCALEGNAESVCECFADLVAIGTIADVMPLTDENRLIASIGLERLRRTDNVGLRALMEALPGVLSRAVYRSASPAVPSAMSSRRG